MPPHHVFGNDEGALRPKTQAVVITTSDAAQTLAMPSRCFASCSSVNALAYPSRV